MNFVPCLQLRGLGGSKQTLCLLECTSLALHRLEDLDYLEVWAPKLTYLRLQACWGLDYVRLRPNEGSSVEVNLTNTNIDRVAFRHLKLHPRVDLERMTHNDDDEPYV